jgi:hypothetical protein
LVPNILSEMVRIGQQAPDPVIVDVAPVVRVAASDIGEWAAGQRVFVSSVMGGMAAEREAAVWAINEIGAEPVWFEDFGGMDDDPGVAYTTEVASSDIYVGILGRRYGAPLGTGYSATHAEYNEAVRRGLRISIWTTGNEQDGRQHDFLEEVRTFQTTGTYTSPHDLTDRLATRLQRIGAESLAPWVKVGNTVFRSTTVQDDGKTITLVGRAGDDSIAASPPHSSVAGLKLNTGGTPRPD